MAKQPKHGTSGQTDSQTNGHMFIVFVLRQTKQTIDNELETILTNAVQALFVCQNIDAWFIYEKQGRIHGNPVADSWAGAVMQKPLGIKKSQLPTNLPTYQPTQQGVEWCVRD